MRFQTDQVSLVRLKIYYAIVIPEKIDRQLNAIRGLIQKSQSGAQVLNMGDEK